MPQVGNDEVNGRSVYIVGCPRKDCPVQATVIDANGEATLLPAWSHLLAPALVT